MNPKKKLYLSIGIAVVTIGAAVAGTYAYLSAQRTVTASKFTAGTLDMDVSSNGNKLEPFVIENMGENGNISGTKTWTIKNTGSLPGKLLLRLQGVANKDNGCNDQEKATEPTCEANDIGELGNVVTLKVALDGSEKASSLLTEAQQSQIGEQWNAIDPVIINAGDSKTITASWATDENAYGNEVQSDSVNFDMNFRMIQLIAGPSPTN